MAPFSHLTSSYLVEWLSEPKPNIYLQLAKNPFQILSMKPGIKVNIGPPMLTYQ